MTDPHDPAAPTANPEMGSARTLSNAERETALTWRPDCARTADDLWRWLFACRRCGEYHPFRLVPDRLGYGTYAHPDGHAYVTRVGVGATAGRAADLRAEWEREAR